jgi:excisionase family DNA binding protein
MAEANKKVREVGRDGNDNVARRFLRVRRVAHELDMSRPTVYDLINSGQLRAVKVGASLRVPADEFERFCNSRDR